MVITPKHYQLEAVEALERNEWCGILEMATGTGKTITSLLAAKRYYEQNQKLFLIIVIPFTHLIEQWEVECEKFGFEYAIRCFSGNSNWRSELSSAIRLHNYSHQGVTLVITTYKTAAGHEFQLLLQKLREHAMLIADECHYLGAPKLRWHNVPQLKARIGLSATPERYWDEAGTTYLLDFFHGIRFRYEMREAIENGFLSPYIYQPIRVGLDEDELTDYQKLTDRIIKLQVELEAGKSKADQTRKPELLIKQIEELSDKLDTLRIARSAIINKARQKKSTLLGLLNRCNRSEVSHTLVYCAPGEIEELTKRIAEMGYRVHRFDSKVGYSLRERILRAFDTGDIQILVAIKCLDEGVDVPSTRVAYFLASTSNPREFVQRRGRILRRAPGKNQAEIIDFIVLPLNADEMTTRSILRREHHRMSEFISFATNATEVTDSWRHQLESIGLGYLITDELSLQNDETVDITTTETEETDE
jgi:superfamily II DNA or RNA helicase